MIKEYKRVIQNFVDGFGTGCSKENMVSKVHRYLISKNIDNCILNDKYIEIDGTVIELIRKRSIGVWIVK